MFPKSTIESQADLLVLVAEARLNLNSNRVPFLYPVTLTKSIPLEEWRAISPEIEVLNAEALDAITNRGGVYAIYVGDSKDEMQLMYVGQTNASGARSRIRSHLVFRNKETTSGRSTGSKFDEVFAAVTAGKLIYMSFCEISPDSLRHFVEESLFPDVVEGWNVHGARKKKPKAPKASKVPKASKLPPGLKVPKVPA